MHLAVLAMLKPPFPRERGVTLIVVMIILVIVTIVGIAGARIALLGERSTRFDRDYQIAWEAAEAALIDAEFDIGGPNTAAGNRVAKFRTDDGNTGVFVPDCGTTDDTRGLCAPATGAVPVWQSPTFDFVTEAPATQAFTTFGDRTGRAFQSGTGIQPAQKPHYIIEWVYDQRPGRGASTLNGAARPIMYRITAIGFGPNLQTQVMMQSAFVKKDSP